MQHDQPQGNSPCHQREVLLSFSSLVAAPQHVPMVSCKQGTAFLPFVAGNCYSHVREGEEAAAALKQLEPHKVLPAADLSPSSSSHSTFLSRLKQLS